MNKVLNKNRTLFAVGLLIGYIMMAIPMRITMTEFQSACEISVSSEITLHESLRNFGYLLILSVLPYQLIYLCFVKTTYGGEKSSCAVNVFSSIGLH